MQKHLLAGSILALGLATTAMAQGAGPITNPLVVGASAQATSGPIPEGDIAALIKSAGLVESQKTAKEMTPGGWVKPKMMLVAIDRPDRIAWLQPAVPGVKLIGLTQRGTLAENEAEMAPYIGEADALIRAAPNALCTANAIKLAKKLKWIHHNAAGPESCVAVSDQVKGGKFLFTSSQKLYSDGVADSAIAMMTSLMRGLDLYARMDADKKVKRPNFGERGWTFNGRTLLVVGLGGIGTDIARMAHGVGMKVIATRASSHEGPDFVDYVGLSNELPGLIGKADVVVMAAPLVDDTRGLFDAKMFARMKRGTLFINVAREEEYVEADLIAALKSGQVGGAGIELNTKPEGDGGPLFDAPNTIIEVHGGAPAQPVGGYGDTTNAKIWLVARENMRRYALGEKMLSVVDVKRGY